MTTQQNKYFFTITKVACGTSKFIYLYLAVYTILLNCDFLNVYEDIDVNNIIIKKFDYYN